MSTLAYLVRLMCGTNQSVTTGRVENVLVVVEVLGLISLTMPGPSQGTDPEYVCVPWELIGSPRVLS